MYYLLAFVCGAIVGAVVSFFVVKNNQKKVDEMEKRLRDTLK